MIDDVDSMVDHERSNGASLTEAERVLHLHSRSHSITFTRPEPTRFVLLVGRTGPGSGGTVTGTENFKPQGTEWATEEDLKNAGFVSIEIAEIIMSMISQAAQHPGMEDVLVGRAMGLLARRSPQ